MPYYDYRCPKCGYRAEVFHKINEGSIVTCSNNHKEVIMQAIPSKNVGFQFKGSGFYVNDYPKG